MNAQPVSRIQTDGWLFAVVAIAIPLSALVYGARGPYMDGTFRTISVAGIWALYAVECLIARRLLLQNGWLVRGLVATSVVIGLACVSFAIAVPII